MKFPQSKMIFIVSIPVCTSSPIFSSDILTDFPLARFTVAAAGKQPPDGQ